MFAKTVTVETNKRDKYKRSVGKVLMDGVDANLVQVQRGFAWHYKAYEREQPAIDRKVYAPMLKTKPEPLGVVCGPKWNLCRLGSVGPRRSKRYPPSAGFLLFGLETVQNPVPQSVNAK